MIVRDGEGATKFITMHVEGGATDAECRQVAYAIAHSPLVKTAFFASDPNLGRILARSAMPASTISTSTSSICTRRRARRDDPAGAIRPTAKKTASA